MTYYALRLIDGSLYRDPSDGIPVLFPTTKAAKTGYYAKRFGEKILPDRAGIKVDKIVSVNIEEIV